MATLWNRWGYKAEGGRRLKNMDPAASIYPLPDMHLEGPLYAPAPNMLQAGCPQDHMFYAI